MSHAGGPGLPPHWTPPPPPPSPPPTGRRLGKALLAAAAAAVVLVVVLVVVVVAAPWSDTDMSTDADGNDVATLDLAFHPAWVIESEAKWSHPGELLYKDMTQPPDTVTWVGLDLDAAEAVDLTMRYAGNPEVVGVWEAVGESAGAYMAAHLLYKGGGMTANFEVDGMATYVALGTTRPADLNELENRLALDGGEFSVGGEDAYSLWTNEPGNYLGFKTREGSTGYLQVLSVRTSSEQPSGHDGEPLDLTVEITYLARP